MCAVLGVSLLVLIGPGLFAIRMDNYRPFFTHGFMGFVAALPPIFFAYAGFEALAQTAGEVRDSTRRLPVIFVKGISATMVIYLLMSVVAFGVLPASKLAGAQAPMADAAARYLPFGATKLVVVGAIMAITTSLNATMLVPSRVAIMLTEDRLAPRWIGRVSAKTGTPIIGLTITFAAALILLLSGQVGLALNIAIFALVILYFLHSIALLVLPRMNPALFGQVTVSVPLWLQRAMAVLSVVSMAALLTQLDLPTIKLIAFWAALGAVLYVSGRVAARNAPAVNEHGDPDHHAGGEELHRQQAGGEGEGDSGNALEIVHD
jgi:amino acid transporter